MPYWIEYGLLIQKHLQNPLAILLLDEEIAEGTRVNVRPHEDGERLDFEVHPPSALSENGAVTPQQVGS